MRRVFLAFSALLALPSPAQVLLSSTTEQDLEGKMEPPPGVVKLIIQDEREDAAQLGECLLDKGLGQGAIESNTEARIAANAGSRRMALKSPLAKKILPAANSCR